MVPRCKPPSEHSDPGLGNTSLLQPQPCSAAQVCCGMHSLCILERGYDGLLCLMSNRWGLRQGQSQPVLSLSFRLVVRETVPCSHVWPHKASIWTSLSLLSSQRKENLWKIKKDKNKTQASLVPLLVMFRFISSPYCVGPDGSSRYSSFKIILLELHDSLQLKQGQANKNTPHLYARFLFS